MEWWLPHACTQLNSTCTHACESAASPPAPPSPKFSWDNVKSDKDREFYLGHSVKALAGRWQKNKDVYWCAACACTAHLMVPKDALERRRSLLPGAVLGMLSLVSLAPHAPY